MERQIRKIPDMVGLRINILLIICYPQLCWVPVAADSSKYDMCLTSRREAQEVSVGITSETYKCSAGHWPLPRTCFVHNSELWYDVKSGAFGTFGNTRLPIDVLRAWNVSAGSMSPAQCTLTVEKSIFMPIAYDEVSYQSDGSNYYVIQVDAAIPLWSYMRSQTAVGTGEHRPVIFGFAFNVKGEINFTTDAFRDTDRYWVRSLQLLFDHHLLVPGTESGLRAYALRSLQGRPPLVLTTQMTSEQIATICFREVRFGVPLLDLPSRSTVRRYAAEYRQARDSTCP